MDSMNYIKMIRENLKDPKKKALTQLGLYFIFFLVVFILLRSAGSYNSIPSENVTPQTPIEKYEEMKGYTYKVTYTNIDKTDIIEGTYYDNKSLFTFNNFKYYYEDSLYLIDNDTYYLNNIEYNISKVFNKNLSSIIKELEEESKTEYKDGTIVTNYIIDSNKMYKYLYELEGTYTNLVSVSIKENESEIHNIVIDLSNLGLNLIKIEVEYMYLDQVTNLDFNKDNYTYKESL